MKRYFIDGDPMKGTTANEVEYTVQTVYVRAGYPFPIGDRASLTPYLQWDDSENPETIKERDFGGDNEAGVADDNRFTKVTA
ncbi:MAG: hypothetical protein EXR76_13370, partial [Myxococcales bacterium]|nr:hypothetical protein [Myxococcales bacterium]